MRNVFVLGGLLLVSACTGLASPITVVEGVSTVATGKPLSDHLVSISSGKNCSTVRLNAGRTYCEEDEVNPTPKVWCYRTLANVTCYDRPDPYDGNQRKIGDNSHNTDAE